MFCQVKLFSSCKDIEKLQRSLFLADKCGDNWLLECQLCLSPCGSVLAVARGSRLCLLSPQWDGATAASAFVLCWSGSMASEVTALLAFPVSAREQSSHVSNAALSDWVCIVVGHRSGDLGFYTEQGQLLLSERPAEGPVLRVRCCPGPRSSDVDELYAVFPDYVCCLASSSLLQILRFRRAQLVRVQAGGFAEELVDSPSVVSRKLGFAVQDVVCDASVVGLEISNTFDHLLTASTHGGFFTGFRSVAPHNTVVVGAGARPFLTFHQALEGGNAQPLLHDVAKAVASKIKSALPGWLGGGGGSTRGDAEVSPPLAAERMLSRYALCDLRRRGLALAASPDRRLLAVCDSLGRVTVVDAKRGTAVRMFKGYRDSQCGFLQVQEDSHKSEGPTRRALFLVLYVEKRGQLEVWPLRGPRIAIFSAAQHARLLYSPAGGPRRQSSRRSRSGPSAPSLILIDPDGSLKQIIVPFHFSLGNENSDRARDVHLVRRLRQLIKDKECDREQLKIEVVNTANELKTVDIKTHCLEMMAASRNVSPDLLLTCVRMLTVEESDVSGDTGGETDKFKVLTDNLNALVRLFMNVNEIDYEDESEEFLPEIVEEKPANDVTVEDAVEEVAHRLAETEEVAETPVEEIGKEVDDSLFITKPEMENLQHLLNLADITYQKRNQHQKVTFVEDKKSLHSDFISSFDTCCSDDILKLKDTATQECLLFVSQQIFDRFVAGKSDWIAMSAKSAKSKCLPPSELCKLLFTYWMALPISEMTHTGMEKVGSVLLEICRTEGFESVYVGYNETSPWWKSVRDFLVNAPCPFKSMVTAQLCRSVARKIERKVENNGNGLDDGIWESVSKDNAQWGLLIGKLDDISLLSIVLSQKLEAVSKLPRLDIELPEINLKYIYNSGKGSISELAAKWLCTAGVDPADILQHYYRTDSEHSTDKEEDRDSVGRHNGKMAQVGSMSLYDKLDMLKKQFPHSLTGDNLIVNMCWEYSKCWQKNIEELRHLEAALHCIKSVQHPRMQRGICCLVWSTHLLFSFAAAYKLISKVGKLPREKLSRQNVGLSDAQLLKFLETVTDFFDSFLSSAVSENASETVLVKYESIWEDNGSALTELALNNSDVNVDILQVHYELCLVVYYQCYLGSNFWKHMTYLFNVDSQKCVFGPLKAGGGGTLVHQSTDSRVAEQRGKFLSRLVQRCTELATDRDLWVERIQELARIWRIDGDNIRRELVIRLYAQGLDEAAEAALSDVAELQLLDQALVPLAARRLKRFIVEYPKRADIVDALPPGTIGNLRGLEDVSDEMTSVTSLGPTRRLLEDLAARGERQGGAGAGPRLAAFYLEACVTLQQHLGL